MKWRTVLCTALFLCGTVLLSACGGGEMPAPAEPPASSEGSAPSQPEEVPAPSESASSSEPEPLPEPEPPKPWDGMVVPEGCKAEWRVTSGVLVMTQEIGRKSYCRQEGLTGFRQIVLKIIIKLYR